MSKAISPLRYPGGKSTISPYLVSLFPDFKEYREPFLGGGSVFFQTYKTYRNQKTYWLNDLNTHLYYFWKQVKTNNECLYNSVVQQRMKNLNSSELYKINKAIYFELIDELDIAVSYYILNRISFSGIGYSGGYSKLAGQKYLTIDFINRIKKVEHYFFQVKLTNLSYEMLFENVDKDVFLFLDPPYNLSKDSNTLYGVRGDMHKNFLHSGCRNFAEVCRRNIDTCKWMITFNNLRSIKKLFEFANIIEYKLPYSMNNTTRGSSKIELIITNY